MKQIDRIKHYEEILDKGEEVVYGLLDALNKYEDYKKDLKRLKKYYGSRQYMKDVESYENRELPQDLKCGVLGEDYTYDLICADMEIQKRIK